jgi:hypothetical protein
VHERQKKGEEEINSKFLGGFFSNKKEKELRLLVGLVGWLSKLAARPTPPKERGKKKECTLVSVHGWI